LCDDVRAECENYGKVVSVKVRRPENNGSQVTGLGKVFVEYTNRDGATFARNVRITFYSNIFIFLNILFRI
jgi:hypothetical protein